MLYKIVFNDYYKEYNFITLYIPNVPILGEYLTE